MFLRADPCCRSVIKEFARAFSCAYVELWMHLRSLKSTQKLLLRIFRALQTSHAHPQLDIRTAKHEQILKWLS